MKICLRAWSQRNNVIHEIKINFYVKSFNCYDLTSSQCDGLQDFICLFFRCTWRSLMHAWAAKSLWCISLIDNEYLWFTNWGSES